MRIRMLKSARLYWNYAVQEIEKGSEHVGDLARHLLDNSPEGTVEVLESDPEPHQEPVASEGEQPPTAAADGDAAPVNGTIDELMAWIGGDPDRKAAALVAEQAKDKPRATVLKRLGGAE